MNQDTFEAVDAHVQSLDLSTFKSDEELAATKKVGAVALSPEQLASIYQGVRPILLLVSGLWFFPAKWQTILKTFLSYMDAITGSV